MSTDAAIHNISWNKFRISYEQLVFALLVITTFCFPWGELIQIPLLHQVAPITLVGHVLLITWLIKIIIFRKIKAPSRGFIFLFLFLLWGAFSLLWSADVSTSLAALRSFLGALVYGYIIWDMALNERRLTVILLAYVFGAYVNILGIIHSYYIGFIDISSNRYSAFGYNPNDFAFIVVLAVPISWQLYLKFKETPGVRQALFCFPFFATYAIYIACSKSAYIALLIALVFLGRIFAKKFIAKEKAASIVFSIITLAAIIIYPPKFIVHGNIIRSFWTQNNVMSLAKKPVNNLPVVSKKTPHPLEFNSAGGSVKEKEHKSNANNLSVINDKADEQSVTFNGRLIIWKDGLKLFLLKPITGSGFGAFRAVLYQRFLVALAPHNFLIQIVVEVGLVGLLFFLSSLVALFFGLRESLGEYKFYMVLGVMWLVGLVTQNYLYSFATYFLFSCATAAAFLARQTNSQQIIEQNNRKVIICD
jgi:hypothetical protein